MDVRGIEMEVGMGEGVIAVSFPWEMWEFRDPGHLTERVKGFEKFLPSINYLSLSMSTHIHISLIGFLHHLSFMQNNKWKRLR